MSNLDAKHPNMEHANVSERFCAADSDITIRSSDNVLFKVHRKNLEFHSDVFAGTSDFVSGVYEIVEFSETAAVLDLLFQFMYRQPQPELSFVRFEIRFGLAEAAEKYRVFSATQVCKVYMRDSIPDHPLEVLGYAATYGYHDICNQAAPKSIGSPLTSAYSLSPQVFRRWVIYREAWINVLKLAFEDAPTLHHALHRGGAAECESWARFRLDFITSIGRHWERLQHLEEVFESEMDEIAECNPCQIRANFWKKILLTEIEKIPPFMC